MRTAKQNTSTIRTGTKLDKKHLEMIKWLLYQLRRWNYPFNSVLVKVAYFGLPETAYQFLFKPAHKWKNCELNVLYG